VSGATARFERMCAVARPRDATAECEATPEEGARAIGSPTHNCQAQCGAARRPSLEGTHRARVHSPRTTDQRAGVAFWNRSNSSTDRRGKIVTWAGSREGTQAQGTHLKRALG